ncbi:MAG: rhodanese-like domain-containing protein [Desulfobacterales bacterium]
MVDKQSVQRITPEAAKAKMDSGIAIVVCAYKDDNKCKGMQIKGSFLQSEFEDRLPELSKEQEIIFYCN